MNWETSLHDELVKDGHESRIEDIGCIQPLRGDKEFLNLILIFFENWSCLPCPISCENIWVCLAGSILKWFSCNMIEGGGGAAGHLWDQRKPGYDVGGVESSCKQDAVPLWWTAARVKVSVQGWGAPVTLDVAGENLVELTGVAQAVGAKFTLEEVEVVDCFWDVDWSLRNIFRHMEDQKEMLAQTEFDYVWMTSCIPHRGQSPPRRQTLTFSGDRSSQARPWLWSHWGTKLVLRHIANCNGSSNIALGQFASSLIVREKAWLSSTAVLQIHRQQC